MSRAPALAGLWLAAALAAGCATSRPYRVEPRFVPALDLPNAGPAQTRVEALYGRVLLVNFMATWCLPCLQELPDLVAVQQRYAPQGFTVVMVGMDLEGAAVLQPFADHYQLPFPLLVADEAMRAGQTDFGRIHTLPMSFLIGRDGKLRAAAAGLLSREDLHKKIEAALEDR